MKKGYVISFCLCLWQICRHNSAIFAENSSTTLFLNWKNIDAASICSVCIFKMKGQKMCLSEVSCKSENTGHHHHKVIFMQKGFAVLPWTEPFVSVKESNKTIQSSKEKYGSFFLLVSFAAMKNFSISLLIILLANSHCLIYKITARTSRHVCLLSENLNSREFKKLILH